MCLWLWLWHVLCQTRWERSPVASLLDLHPCSGVSCPSLAAPEHGTIRYSNGNKFGSRATYECDQGYALEGSKHRNCQGDMWWGPTDSIPYCTKEGRRGVNWISHWTWQFNICPHLSSLLIRREDGQDAWLHRATCRRSSQISVTHRPRCCNSIVYQSRLLIGFIQLKKIVRSLRRYNVPLIDFFFSLSVLFSTTGHQQCSQWYSQYDYNISCWVFSEIYLPDRLRRVGSMASQALKCNTRRKLPFRNGTTTSECTFLGQWTFATLKCTRKSSMLVPLLVDDGSFA